MLADDELNAMEARAKEANKHELTHEYLPVDGNIRTATKLPAVVRMDGKKIALAGSVYLDFWMQSHRDIPALIAEVRSLRAQLAAARPAGSDATIRAEIGASMRLSGACPGPDVCQERIASLVARVTPPAPEAVAKELPAWVTMILNTPMQALGKGWMHDTLYKLAQEYVAPAPASGAEREGKAE